MKTNAVTDNKTLKKLNDDLRESREQLEFTLDAAEIGTWDLNPATGRFTCNARLKSWFGLEPEEEIPLENATNVIAEEDRSRVIEAIMKAMNYASGGEYNIEYTIVNPFNPEPRYVRARGRALFNKEKKAIRFSGILQDITDERTALEVVYSNRQRLEQAYEQIRLSNRAAELGMFDMDPLNGNLEWDERCRVLFGISHKNRVTYEKDFLEGLHPADRSRIEKIISNLFIKEISNGVYDVEYRTVGAEDGIIRWVRAKGKVLFDRKGAPVRFIGSVLDITGQVESRLQLQRAEQMLRFAIEAANIGTYFLDSKTRTLLASPRLKELFGFYAEQEMSYEAALRQITEDYRENVMNGIEIVFNKGQDFFMEFKITGLNDQKPRWVRAVGKLDKSGFENNTIFAGAMIDITEQKLDDNRKNDFIGMVSHELKTPLTSLSVILQVLEAKFKNHEDDFIPAIIGKATVQVNKMVGMINGFLNVSRLESGKIQIIKSPFNLEALIVEIIRETELTLSGHLIHFRSGHTVMINADYEKIGSVISNLLSNAVKYSAKGKNIDVACISEGNYAIVSVADEGIGINPEDIEKLFDRYYRVEENNNHPVSGFGIGLYLSAEIIQRHQGSIWVESEKGIGSVFYFSVPLNSGEASG